MNITNIKKAIKKVIPEFAYAHCDIPCGIQQVRMLNYQDILQLKKNLLNYVSKN